MKRTGSFVNQRESMDQSTATHLGQGLSPPLQVTVVTCACKITAFFSAAQQQLTLPTEKEALALRK
eukprot:scaffold98281_cov22-Tisochrysis_lutea.AAC.1